MNATQIVKAPEYIAFRKLKAELDTTITLVDNKRHEFILRGSESDLEIASSLDDILSILESTRTQVNDATSSLVAILREQSTYTPDP
jgi:hypothetical protein